MIDVLRAACATTMRYVFLPYCDFAYPLDKIRRILVAIASCTDISAELVDGSIEILYRAGPHALGGYRLRSNRHAQLTDAGMRIAGAIKLDQWNKPKKDRYGRELRAPSRVVSTALVEHDGTIRIYAPPERENTPRQTRAERVAAYAISAEEESTPT